MAAWFVVYAFGCLAVLTGGLVLARVRPEIYRNHLMLADDAFEVGAVILVVVLLWPLFLALVPLLLIMKGFEAMVRAVGWRDW